METYDALLASITPVAGETRTILDPATGQPVGEAPVHTVEDLEPPSPPPPPRSRPGPRWATTPGPPRCSRPPTPSNAPPRNSPGCSPASRANR